MEEPVDKMLEGEREKLLHMEDMLAKRVIGQREAVTAVAMAAARRARAGLQDPNRPIGALSSLAPQALVKLSLQKLSPVSYSMMKPP